MITIVPTVEERVLMGKVLKRVQELRAKHKELYQEEQSIVEPVLMELLKAHRHEIAVEHPVAVLRIDPPQILVFDTEAEYQAKKSKGEI